MKKDKKNKTRDKVRESERELDQDLEEDLDEDLEDLDDLDDDFDDDDYDPDFEDVEIDEDRRRRRAKRAARNKKKNGGGMRTKTLIFCICIILFALACLGGSIWFVRGLEKKKEAPEETQTETETETEYETETEEPEEAKTVDLVMIGDVMLHKDVYNTIEKEEGVYDYSPLFTHVKPLIQEADLALVNQEVIIGGEELGVKAYPKFNAAFSLADTLVDTGFDVILHASNHAYDMGVKGVYSCLENWKTKYPNIAVLGIHDGEDSRDEIYVYEQDKIRIAILNYTELLNNSKKLKNPEKKWLVDRMTETRVRADIQKAHTMADIVVVCPHWGKEYSEKINGVQKKFARIFAEEGVDLVLGTHPHVGEPIETVTDILTGHETLVYYSLGNFTTNITKKSGYVLNRLVGGMAKVSFGMKDDGRFGIVDYGVMPLICHFTPDKTDYTVYTYDEYSESLAQTHQAVAFKKKFSMEEINNLCDKLWGTLWRKEVTAVNRGEESLEAGVTEEAEAEADGEGETAELAETEADPT